SEFKHQALADLLPVRDMFVSFFFVAIGMTLNVFLLIDQITVVLALFAAVVLLKAAIVFLVGTTIRLPFAMAVQSGLALSQVGEFSLIMLGALPDGLVPLELHQSLVAAIVLSMAFTPFAMRLGPYVERFAQRFSAPVLDLGEPDPHSPRAVLVGFGPTGQCVAQKLREGGAEVTIVDANPLNVRLAHARGFDALLGDATQRHILLQTRLNDATLLVVSINAPRATVSIVGQARHLARELPILTRAQYAIDEDDLRASGADRVVVAETAAADRVASFASEMLAQGAAQGAV
ncbi:MAG: NAD-binding protein, partial [Myxococcota bacterium]